jgi:alkanesulfonate monooxygenase SsuD/methylene tetrahydromethanopterin reductase-like flavin-dependent oxidoreductase (luciferase family)
MWAGFGGPLGARIAGRLGLGLQSTDRDLVPVYLGALEEAGQPMAAGRLAAQYEFLVARDPERTRALVGDRIAYRWESYNRHMFEGTSREADAPDFFDAEARREGFVVGTPDQIADQITRDIEGLPVSDVYVWGDFAGAADTIIEEHLELTFTKVAPLLKGR